MSEPTCKQYPDCTEQRPHFHFKVRDGERLMFTAPASPPEGAPT